MRTILFLGIPILLSAQNTGGEIASAVVDSPSSTTVQPESPPPANQQMGGFVQIGYVWNMDVVLTNPDPTIWGTSAQGYDAKLGTSQLVTLGVWGQMNGSIQSDLSFTIFLPFHYQKYVTDVATGLPSVMFFDLAHQNMMLSVRFLPSSDYSVTVQNYVLSFFAEAGVGASMFEVTNFHSVDFQPGVGVASTTDIANRYLSPSIAAQVGAGVRIQTIFSNLTLDIIGRYYKGGTFTSNGTAVQNTPIGGGLQVPVTPWQGSFTATQIVVSLNINV